MPRFSDHPDFDISLLSTDKMRRHFANVLARISEAAGSVIEGYRPQGDSSTIRGCFKRTTDFNAAVWRANNSFVVGLSASVIPLLVVLFAALLSDRRVLPKLPARSGKKPDEAHFFFDIGDTKLVTKFRLLLTQERLAAADALADLCISFVYLHELGHILCGHVDATNYLLGESSLTELARNQPSAEGPRGPGAVSKATRRYWEYQADSVAAQLIPQYIDTLISRADRIPWMRMIGREGKDRPSLVMRMTALTSTAISVMFIYMEGCRLRRRVPAVHPHPITRSLYVKNRIVRAASERWGCDPQRIGRLIFPFLEPMLFRLEELGLGSVRKWDPVLLDEFDLEGRRLGRGGAHREVARRWSWVPVDAWA